MANAQNSKKDVHPNVENPGANIKKGSDAKPVAAMRAKSSYAHQTLTSQRTAKVPC